jgi:hypothetical protein
VALLLRLTAGGRFFAASTLGLNAVIARDIRLEGLLIAAGRAVPAALADSSVNLKSLPREGGRM